jgi:hypothetical protein
LDGLGDTALDVVLDTVEPPAAVADVDDVGLVPGDALADVVRPEAVLGVVEFALGVAPGLVVTDGDVVTVAGLDTAGAVLDIGAAAVDVTGGGGVVIGAAAVVVTTGASWVTVGGAATVVVTTGASWVTTGASWVTTGASWVTTGASWVTTGGTIGAWVGGAGATVVVVTGEANAGTTPPVSAVNEMAAPEARTTATPRTRQIRSGALVEARLLSW